MHRARFKHAVAALAAGCALALPAAAQEDTADLTALLPQLLALPGAGEIVAELHRPPRMNEDIAARLERSFATREIAADLQTLDCGEDGCEIEVSVPLAEIAEGIASVESWIAVEQPCAYSFRPQVTSDTVVITARTLCDS